MKVSPKFTLKINPINVDKKGKKNTNKPASVEKLPPPILAKTLKEVNEISKFFKMIDPIKLDNNRKRSYAQTLKSGISTKETINIKELFPSLKTDKINNIQKIINRGGKLKPYINMTTKGLSRKQVIISMNNDNKAKFMEKSSTHVTNINRALKNIKSKIIVDFI